MTNINHFFKILEIPEIRGQDISIFNGRNRLPSSRPLQRQGNSHDYFRLLEPPTEQTSSNKIIYALDINLNIHPDLFKNKVDLKMIPDMNILLKIYEACESYGVIPYVQVRKKMGDIHKIEVYQIIKNISKLELSLKKKGNLNAEEYNMYFAANQEEYYGVSVLYNIQVPEIFFNNISGRLFEQDILYEVGHNYIYSDMISLKILAKLMIQKNIVNTNIEKIDDINIYPISSLTGPPIAKRDFFKFKSLNIIDEKNVLDSNLDTYSITADIRMLNKPYKNISHLYNIYSYNILYTDINTSSPIFGYQILESSTWEHSVKYLPNSDYTARHNFILTDIKLILKPIETSLASADEIEKIHQDVYNLKISELKIKWDALLSRAKTLLKLSPLDESLLAVSFITKYFLYIKISLIEVRYYLGTSKESDYTFLINLFSAYVTPFNDFFGNNVLFEYTQNLAKLKSRVYLWNKYQNKLNKYGIMPQGLSNTDTEISNKLFPKTKIISFNGERNQLKSKSENIILINDTGTKTVWIKKIRSILMNLGFNLSKKDITYNYLIIDPSEKIELVMIKKYFSQNRNAILMSDFFKNNIKLINMSDPSKVKTPKIPKYYNFRSFATASSPKGILTSNNIDYSDKVFLEYTLSKNSITFKGKTYVLSDFDLPQWSTIIQKYTGKELLLAGNLFIKNVKKNGGVITLLEDYIESQPAKNMFRALSRDFILIDQITHTQLLNRFNLYWSKELLSPIMQSDDLTSSGGIKFARCIIDGLPKNLKNIIEHFIIGICPNSITKSLGRLYYFNGGVNSTDKNTYIYRYDINSTSRFNGLNHILYDMIPKDLNNQFPLGELEVFISTNKRAGSNFHSRYDYNFKHFLAGYKDVLEYSNTQNLNLEEQTHRKNIYILSYLHRWHNANAKFKITGEFDEY